MNRRDDHVLDRRRSIASKLGLTERSDKPGQFEGQCPECGRGGFSIKAPDRANYLHIWVCAARRSCCTPETVRAAMLRAGVPANQLGGYGLDLYTGTDPVAAAVIREAINYILASPSLDASFIRIVLAEARGDKFPDDYSELARFYRDIGIGRRQSYNLAEKHCRPTDVPHPGGGSADA